MKLQSVQIQLIVIRSIVKIEHYSYFTVPTRSKTRETSAHLLIRANLEPFCKTDVNYTREGNKAWKEGLLRARVSEPF